MFKRQKKVRGKARFFIYSVFVLVGLYCLYNFSTQCLKNFNLFAIKKVQIVGNKYLSEESLKSVSDDLIGQNFFTQNLTDIELRYKVITRINDVKCKKKFPSKLKICIKEREGVFFIKDNEGVYYPIDYERIVLDKSDWYIQEDLPLININLSIDSVKIGQKIVDNNVEEIFKIYETMKSSYAGITKEISEFYIKNNNIHYIDMKSGCRVKINAENISSQIKRFVFLRDNQGFRKNSTIDIRFESQIIVI